MDCPSSWSSALVDAGRSAAATTAPEAATEDGDEGEDDGAEHAATAGDHALAAEPRAAAIVDLRRVEAGVLPESHAFCSLSAGRRTPLIRR